MRAGVFALVCVACSSTANYTLDRTEDFDGAPGETEGSAGSGALAGADSGAGAAGSSGSHDAGGSAGDAQSSSDSNAGGTLGFDSVADAGQVDTGGETCGQGKKFCGGRCVSFEPHLGCSGPVCAQCYTPRNGVSWCNITGDQACTWGCDPGFVPAGLECVPAG